MSLDRKRSRILVTNGCELPKYLLVVALKSTIIMLHNKVLKLLFSQETPSFYIIALTEGQNLLVFYSSVVAI